MSWKPYAVIFATSLIIASLGERHPPAFGGGDEKPVAPASAPAAAGDSAADDPTPEDPTPKDPAEGEPPAESPPLVQTVVREGVEVTLEVSPLDGATQLVVGDEARLSYTIRDATSGEPITGLHPLSWVHRRSGTLKPTTEEIQELVSTFLGGLLSIRADIDLNRYFLLLLNPDSTISVVDPLIEFSRTKLHSLIQLQGPGEAWVIDPIRERLYVSIPGKGRVEFIDLTTFRSIGFVEVGEGLAPRDLVVSPDGSVLWVGLDASNAVLAVDTEKRRVLERIRVGIGMHRLILSDDGATMAVTSSGSGEVAIIDVDRRELLGTELVEGRPYALRHSAASGLFYVGDALQNRILVVDPGGGGVLRTIETEGPNFSLDIDPSGRFLFACDIENSTVTIIDVATDERIGFLRGAGTPDQVAFSSNFAYVRGLDSRGVILVDLSRLARGEVIRTDLAIGRLPPSDAATSSSVTRMIRQTPESSSVMIANPADKLVYFYIEGMMASMGNFETYGREPRGLEILDRSLQETAPGVYTTYIRPTVPGRSDVPFVLDQPRVVHGFELEVLPPANQSAPPAALPVTIESLFSDQRFTVGDTRELRFRVLDSATGDPVPGLLDVHVMVIQGQGVRQERYVAEEVEPGTYAFTHEFLARDRYQVLFQVLSRGGTFRDLPLFVVPVLRPDEGSPWQKPDRPRPKPLESEATGGGGE